MITEAYSGVAILQFCYKISFWPCFKVPEKRWYWLKVFALATTRDWEALEKFSKEKRPPIGKLLTSFLFESAESRLSAWPIKGTFCFVIQPGYRPFVEACVDAEEKNEALKYIPKLTDPRERAEVIQILSTHLRLVWYVIEMPVPMLHIFYG